MTAFSPALGPLRARRRRTRRPAGWALLLWASVLSLRAASAADAAAPTAPDAAPEENFAETRIPRLQALMVEGDAKLERLKAMEIRYQDPFAVAGLAPDRARLVAELRDFEGDFYRREKEFNRLRDTQDFANAWGVVSRVFRKGESPEADPAVVASLRNRKFSRDASAWRRKFDDALAGDERLFAEGLRVRRYLLLGASGVLVLLALLFGASALAVRNARAKALLETQISTLAAAARRVGGGDLSVEVPVLAVAGLGDLARRFNAMVGQLRILDEMKDEFIASVSHDLRSPMAAIETTLDYMLNDDENRAVLLPEQRRMLESLVESAGRLDVFVSNILDSAKMKAGRMEHHPGPVAVDAIARGLEQLYGAAARRKGIEWKVDVPPGLPAVRADPERLERALTNLVSNAMKFTRAGGSVTLAAAPMDGAVEIRVQDTGKGIAKEDLPRLFKRFEQADAAGRKSAGIVGTGLGLYIVKEAVEAMGGSVAVDSELGRGTRVSLRLPLAAGKGFSAPAVPAAHIAAGAAAEENGLAAVPAAHIAAGAAAEENGPVAAPGPSRRILVVDDDAAFAETLKQMLAAKGFSVCAVHQGGAAFEAAAREKPDLIVMDMELGDALGTDVIRDLKGRSQTARIPVILCSALSGEGAVRSALEAGAACYVQKPVKARELDQRIRETLTGRPEA